MEKKVFLAKLHATHKQIKEVFFQMPEGIVGSSFEYVIDANTVREFLSLEDIDQVWVMFSIE